MSINTEWQVSAETQAEMTVDGVTYTDVVTVVHWLCIATDDATGISETIYGSTDIPAPTDPQTYIDVSALLTMDATARRAAVLGWAELIQPGMEQATVDQVTALLQARLTAPAKSSITVLP